MRRLVCIAGVLVSSVAPGAVFAGCVCGTVVDPPAGLHACLGPAEGPCEAILTEAAEDALVRWRAFAPLYASAGPPPAGTRRGDGRNDVVVRSVAEIGALYGVEVAPWVLGITFAPPVRGLVDGNATCPLPPGVECPDYGGAPADDVDVVLVADRRFTTDPLVAWASHLRGDAERTWDVRQVLEHELGHAHGLRHEDRVPALMNPFHLEFPGVTLLADDARTLRAAAPDRATALGDLAVVGFAADGSTFFGVSFEADGPGPLRPGRDRVRVSGFTVTNRNPRPQAGVVTEIRIGGRTAGTLRCDLPANGDCPLLDVAEVVVPELPGGRHALEIHTPPLNGEPLPEDNTLPLGFVEVAGPPASADARPDVGVPADAASEADTPVPATDARRPDARTTDAQKADGVDPFADAASGPDAVRPVDAPGDDAAPGPVGARSTRRSDGGCAVSPAAPGPRSCPAPWGLLGVVGLSGIARRRAKSDGRESGTAHRC
jgi:MYXO-CTERM domain-containing protein